MGEEKKRPIWLGCRAKRRRNLEDEYSDAANAGRDFVIKNVALDEGKVLYRARELLQVSTQSRCGGMIAMTSGVVAFADPDPYQVSMRPATCRRRINATLKS